MNRTTKVYGTVICCIAFTSAAAAESTFHDSQRAAMVAEVRSCAKLSPPAGKASLCEDVVRAG